MFLTYKNKKEKEDILNNVKKYSKLELDINKNYLIYGENLIALSKIFDSYKKKVDLIYIDPPYNSNQIFTMSSNRASTISRSSGGDVAYSDDMDIETYFEFIRERLIVLRELLSEEGSIYLHIDDKMGHYIKVIMDEVFGSQNFKNDISRVKSNPKNFGRKAYGNQKDTILFYSKNYQKNIFNNITEPLTESEIKTRFKKIDDNGRRYTTVPIHAPGETKDGVTGQKWKGMAPPEGRHWRYSPDKLTELDNKGLIEWSKNGNPRLKNYADEHKGKKVQDIWVYKDLVNPSYPTQKNLEMLEFIIKQSSNEGSIVLDCFSGSGKILNISHKLNRRFVGIDNSKLAINSSKNILQDIPYTFLDLNNKIKKHNEVQKQLSLI